MNPRLTFFGNAKSEHLAYDKWNSKNLLKITNNQGNCLIAKLNDSSIDIFYTYKKFAETFCKHNWYETHYNSNLNAYFLGTLT